MRVEPAYICPCGAMYECTSDVKQTVHTILCVRMCAAGSCLCVCVCVSVAKQSFKQVLSWLMVETVEPEEVKGPCFLEERQQHSHLRCPSVLLGLTAIAQAHVSTVSSQDRPVKILTAPL